MNSAYTPLQHQLWMPPSPRSTVIEMTYPQSTCCPNSLCHPVAELEPTAYVHDYAILSRNMGHKHYAIWNDSTVTFPEGKWYEVSCFI